MKPAHIINQVFRAGLGMALEVGYALAIIGSCLVLTIVITEFIK